MRHAAYVLFIAMAVAWGPRPAVSESASGPGNGAFSYAAYADLLKKFVDHDGRVDYAGFGTDRAPLDGFVASLASLDRAAYDAWPEADKIAFWINAYNALTLRAVVDHYPIKPPDGASEYPKNSIRQIPGVWDKLGFSVMDSSVTLDGIEHQILRARFTEPRIHMALVCAAASCPPLRREPYAGGTLDSQLDDQTRRFFSRKDNFRIDREQKTVHLSSIFDWFGGDFVGWARAVPVAGERDAKGKATLGFIAGYLAGDDRGFIAGGRFEVKYLPYDWTLNERVLRER